MWKLTLIRDSLKNSIPMQQCIAKGTHQKLAYLGIACIGMNFMENWFYLAFSLLLFTAFMEESQVIS